MKRSDLPTDKARSLARGIVTALALTLLVCACAAKDYSVGDGQTCDFALDVHASDVATHPEQIGVLWDRYRVTELLDPKLRVHNDLRIDLVALRMDTAVDRQAAIAHDLYLRCLAYGHTGS